MKLVAIVKGEKFDMIEIVQENRHSGRSVLERPLPSNIVERALELAFRDKIPTEAKGELIEEIQRQWYVNRCVVLLYTHEQKESYLSMRDMVGCYSISYQTQYSDICNRFNLDQGDKEVIITSSEDGKKIICKFSEDYRVEPKTIKTYLMLYSA